jgi:hypothetical protein
MKLIYKPIGIIFGLLAGQVAKKIFEFIWARFDDAEPPKPTTLRAAWPKIIAAAALQGVVFKVTRAVVDREMAQGFAYLTGTWPGEKEPDEKGLG